MPWQDVPGFYASLTDGSIGSLVVKLLILTATRSAEVRGLRLDEVAGDVWLSRRAGPSRVASTGSR